MAEDIITAIVEGIKIIMEREAPGGMGMIRKSRVFFCCCWRSSSLFYA